MTICMLGNSIILGFLSAGGLAKCVHADNSNKKW